MVERSSWLWVVALAAGCSFTGLSGSDPDGPIGPSDAPVDADPNQPDGMPDGPPLDGTPDGRPDADPPDATPVCATWASQHVDPCLMPPPVAPWHLTAGLHTYNTTNGMLSTGAAPLSALVEQRVAGTPMVRVISVDSVIIDAGAVLTVIGSAPLVIAAWDTMSIAGVIDAGSHFGGVIGAGANPGNGLCEVAGQGEGAAASGGSGGGGGGGFRGDGGGGGQGDNPPGPLGGSGGGLISPAPAFIRGGCHAATSGTAGSGAVTPSTPSTVSSRGAGGGAVHLTARTSIAISPGAAVVAGGAGGGGAPQGSACGGGGGGSGGYVGLDAPTITLMGSVLAANGAGGGASGPFAGSGFAGADGGANATAAPGGMMQSCAPAGGVGGAGSTLSGTTATGTGGCGGGGGGGATGYVMIWSPGFSQSSSTISPTLVLNP